jgi:hypothetical protein
MVAVITRVPSEVCLEVFNVHVWQNGDTPHRLLRVCHHWYSIALNAPSLWGNILYTNKTALAYSSDGIVAENRMRNKVVCISIRELVKAIERTKGCSFELTTVLCYQAPCELLLPYHFILSPPSNCHPTRIGAPSERPDFRSAAKSSRYIIGCQNWLFCHAFKIYQVWRPWKC